MRNVTQEQFEDKNFQKWWARHPLHAVRVDNGKALVHKNTLLIFCAFLTGVLILGTAVDIDAFIWVQYRTDKNTLTDKQLADKYTQNQIARYDLYNKLYNKTR